MRALHRGRRSPLPNEPDVCLRIVFGCEQLDFVACLTAALVFVQEWSARKRGTVTILHPGDTAEFPRLPTERLYIQP